MLSRFRREYPDVEVTIKTGSSIQFIQMILDYKLDGAFIGYPVKNKEIDSYKRYVDKLNAFKK